MNFEAKKSICTLIWGTKKGGVNLPFLAEFL